LPPASAQINVGPEIGSAAPRAGANAPLGHESEQRIPRVPDRPEDYHAYRYPVDAQGFVPTAGRGALELPAARGAVVTAIELENQTGDAEVALVTNLFGTTVVTKHVVKDGARERTYLVVLGYLGRLEGSLAAGAHLPSGAPIGVVGDGPAGTRTQLHLEIRRVQEGAPLAKLDTSRVTDAAMSVPTDPRNVLPLKPK
jgi:hypothetical protein